MLRSLRAASRTLLGLGLSALTPVFCFAAGFSVKAVCPPLSSCDVDGTIVMRSVATPTIEHRAAMQHGVAEVATDAVADWELELTSATHWAAPQRLLLQQGTHALRVWPAARLSGRFVKERKDDEMPQAFQLRIQAPPNPSLIAEDRIPSTTLTCPIAPDGAWRCAVPSVALDLTLRAKSFTPHYRWDVSPKPDSTHDVGLLVLRPAASVVAWLDEQFVELLKNKGARARLVTLAMGDPSPLGERLNRPVAEAQFNSRGMVQLVSVPPGEYTLEIEAEGFAAARFPGLRVFPRSESRLSTPVRLERPLDIELILRPAVDSAGKPWVVTVHRLEEMTGRSVPVSRGAGTEEGVYRVRQQPAGRYRVFINRAEGSMYARQTVMITGVHDASPIIEMSALSIAGKVRMSGEPLTAELLFGGESGAERIRTTSNADGVFDVVLPRDGEWEVLVRENATAINAIVKINVAAAADELEIEVPATEISGWVVRPEGGRAKSAILMLSTPSSTSITARADDRGEFRFRGIAPGRVSIVARDRDTSEWSKARELVASADVPITGIELQIISDQLVAGSVWSQGQPVVGAGVAAYGYGDGAAIAQHTLTGLDGAFSVPIKVTATEIVILVAAAGRTMQAFSVPRSADKPRLELEAAGGTLSVAFPAGAQNRRLRYNGILMAIPELLSWASAQGQRQRPPTEGSGFVVPNVAPGAYQLCFTPLKGGADVCRQGTLARGAQLELIAAP